MQELDSNPVQSPQTSQTPLETQTPQQVYTQQPTDPQLEKPKSKSKLKIVLIVIGVLVLLGVFSIGLLVFKGVRDAPQVQQKVTFFLQNVSNNELETAYDLTSDEFKQSVTKEDFEKSMSLFKAQYSGFQKQEQVGFNVEATSGNPTLYQYSGVITYSNGDQGELEATLVKEEGEYKIQFIHVNVDLERLEKFQQSDS